MIRVMRNPLQQKGNISDGSLSPGPWSLHVLDRPSEPIGIARCTSANKENSNPALTLTSASTGYRPVLVLLLPSSNSRVTPARGGEGEQAGLRCFGLAQILIGDTSSKIRSSTPGDDPDLRPPFRHFFFQSLRHRSCHTTCWTKAKDTSIVVSIVSELLQHVLANLGVAVPRLRL